MLWSRVRKRMRKRMTQGHELHEQRTGEEGDGTDERIRSGSSRSRRGEEGKEEPRGGEKDFQRRGG